ncbi:MAG: hypothetical protein R3F14_16125 [Polyangiaceae bacterium]
MDYETIAVLLSIVALLFSFSGGMVLLITSIHSGKSTRIHANSLQLNAPTERPPNADERGSLSPAAYSYYSNAAEQLTEHFRIRWNDDRERIRVLEVERAQLLGEISGLQTQIATLKTELRDVERVHAEARLHLTERHLSKVEEVLSQLQANLPRFETALTLVESSAKVQEKLEELAAVAKETRSLNITITNSTVGSLAAGDHSSSTGATKGLLTK